MKPVDERVHWHVYQQVDIQQVRKQVDIQVWDQVRGQVYWQVFRPVNRPVVDCVYWQVSDKIKKEIQ